MTRTYTPDEVRRARRETERRSRFWLPTNVASAVPFAGVPVATRGGLICSRCGRSCKPGTSPNARGRTLCSNVCATADKQLTPGTRRMAWDRDRARNLYVEALAAYEARVYALLGLDPGTALAEGARAGGRGV